MEEYIPRRIQEDHKEFRDAIAGKAYKELRRLIHTGKLPRLRPEGGRLRVSCPTIDIPHIAHGDTGEGLWRGKGKPGQSLGGAEKGKGSGAGGEHEDGMVISIDLEDVLQFWQNDFELPDLKPKVSDTFESVKLVYTDISRTGPESLRHTRRTLLEALRRLAMSKEANTLHRLPGFAFPVRTITPINSDRRYRQYREIRKPSSNAVLLFARDCSGSMDDLRCDIVNNMCWWLDCWVRRFYKRVERCYFVHDADAEEVDENKFYRYRQAGGTRCSSVFKAMAEVLENRFPVDQYNIYLFYFTDGDNLDGDNDVVLDYIQQKLGPDKINMLGITQVCPYHFERSVKEYMDQAINVGKFNLNWLRTANIGSDGRGGTSDLTEDQRDQQVMQAIRLLIGKERTRGVA